MSDDASPERIVYSPVVQDVPVYMPTITKYLLVRLKYIEAKVCIILDFVHDPSAPNQIVAQFLRAKFFGLIKHVKDGYYYLCSIFHTHRMYILY